MSRTFQILRTLSLSLWVGGIFFFAFGVAPVAFHVLPSPHEAGLLVGASLAVLHRLGLICGAVYLVVTALARVLSRRATTALLLPSILVTLMLLLTAASQFVIIPRMEADRDAASGDITTLAESSPTRTDFDRLHRLSEKLEGTILLCGILALVLAAAPRDPVSFPY